MLGKPRPPKKKAKEPEVVKEKIKITNIFNDESDLQEQQTHHLDALDFASMKAEPISRKPSTAFAFSNFNFDDEDD